MNDLHNIIPLHRPAPPRDYVERFRFVPSPPKPTRIERIMEWFYRNGERASFIFAMFAVAFVIGVVIAAYSGGGR